MFIQVSGKQGAICFEPCSTCKSDNTDRLCSGSRTRTGPLLIWGPVPLGDRNRCRATPRFTSESLFKLWLVRCRIRPASIAQKSTASAAVNGSESTNGFHGEQCRDYKSGVLNSGSTFHLSLERKKTNWWIVIQVIVFSIKEQEGKLLWLREIVFDEHDGDRQHFFLN